MSYRITYTTDSRPTDLPNGATVEKLPVPPVEFDKDGQTLFALEESSLDDYVSFFWINGKGQYLDRDQTIQVRDALNELLGESAPVEEWDGYSEPPADVVETRDNEDDHWYRLDNGNWSCSQRDTNGVAWDVSEVGPIDYGPHTILRRK